jgi:hypothetical protein
LSSGKVASIGFEVGVTPTEGDVGKSPTLVEGAVLTATDAFTGVVVTAAGVPITTNLPQDEIAAGLGNVEE